jgi:hypothetical protein
MSSHAPAHKTGFTRAFSKGVYKISSIAKLLVAWHSIPCSMKDGMGEVNVCISRQYFMNQAHLELRVLINVHSTPLCSTTPSPLAAAALIATGLTAAAILLGWVGVLLFLLALLELIELQGRVTGGCSPKVCFTV